MTIDYLTERLLLVGSDDWLHLADIAWSVRQFAADDCRDVISIGTEALAMLLDQGLIQVGEVSDVGFVQWEMANADAVARIRREWLALDGEPQPGDVCWIANTPLGNERASRLAEGD